MATKEGFDQNHPVLRWGQGLPAGGGGITCIFFAFLCVSVIPENDTQFLHEVVFFWWFLAVFMGAFFHLLRVLAWALC